MKEKVVLAYSGGIDTTALIPWLKETFDYEVICCCVNCGQGNELDGLDERAKLSGASKLYIEDIVDDFCDNYIMPCVQAGAVACVKWKVDSVCFTEFDLIFTRLHCPYICHTPWSNDLDVWS